MAFDPTIADADWIGTWITGRALARGLPRPFPDRGGWRAEVGADNELRRWIFPGLTPELHALASEIDDPHQKLRVLAASDATAVFLPHGWKVEAPSFAMTRDRSSSPGISLPDRYRVEVQGGDRSIHVSVLDGSGVLAASGHAGVAAEALVFDRIVTQPAYRRMGLGTVVMNALANAAHRPPGACLLVATEMGRLLYERLGWRVVSPYASAAWVGDSPVQN